jgi:hypothetical protein
VQPYADIVSGRTCHDLPIPRDAMLLQWGQRRGQRRMSTCSLILVPTLPTTSSRRTALIPNSGCHTANENVHLRHFQDSNHQLETHVPKDVQRLNQCSRSLSVTLLDVPEFRRSGTGTAFHPPQLSVRRRDKQSPFIILSLRTSVYGIVLRTVRLITIRYVDFQDCIER